MSRKGSGPRLVWRRGAWYIRWTEGGRTCERSTGQADSGEAQKVYYEWLTERRTRPTGKRDKDQYLIADMLAEYAEEHGPTVASPETIGFNMIPLLAFWGTKTVADVHKANCQGYAAERRSQVKDGTIRRELSVLSAAIGHAHKSNRLDIRPHVWMPAPGPAKDRWLTRAEAAALLRAARAEPKARGHLPLFILLALYGAARSGAILSLKWSQVDLDRGTIDWREPGRAETNKGRARIKMPRRLLLALRRVRRADIGHVIHVDGQPVGSIKKAFAGACRRAGLDGVTPHTLRHTSATWMAQAGVPLWEIAGYLGQSVQRTTERYLHHHPDHMARAAAALDA